MKNSNLVKFSLTLICAAVLSACGSSGGGTTGGTSGETGGTTGETGGTTTPAPTVTVPEQVFGAQFVKKTQSEMDVGEGHEVTSKSSTNPNSLLMTIRPFPTLDTIVVAIPEDQSLPATYLEDFDFRTDAAAATAKATDGETTLQHIYNDKMTTKNATARGVETITKKDTMGDDTGVALVYQSGRMNYTTHELKGAKDFVEDISTFGRRTTKYLADKESVAEVYGYRTYAEGDSQTGEDLKEFDMPNAPLGSKDADGRYTKGVQLNHVQYGRVTSKIHGVNPDDLKEGVVAAGNKKTIVGSFGHYNKAGTENQYFFRGTDRTGESVGALRAYYHGPEATTGTIEYQGHAVTYNLDREFDLGAIIPNAVGYQQQLVSGTHVAAGVDLATNKVSGVLYNVWRYGQEADPSKLTYTTPEQFNLATFEGTLANNGYITGTSERTLDKAKGSLDAQLFGKNAAELGGAIASNDTSNNWGATFGATAITPAYVPGVITPPSKAYHWTRLQQK